MKNGKSLTKRIVPWIKYLLRAILRKLKLSPIQRVFRELEKRSVSLKDLDALEVFGASGDFHTKDYSSQVSTLELWEINPKYEKAMKQNFPMAKVKITDSYKEVKNISRKYNLIVVDNPMSIYGDHCEHFDLFPNIFHIARDSTILILDVIPEINNDAKKKYPYLFNKVQLACRKCFYKTDTPEEVSFDEMIEVYRKLAMSNSFEIEWYFLQKRSFVYYLILKIKKLEKSRAPYKANRNKRKL